VLVMADELESSRWPSERGVRDCLMSYLASSEEREVSAKGGRS